MWLIPFVLWQIGPIELKRPRNRVFQACVFC